jgi:hypothetical protein
LRGTLICVREFTVKGKITQRKETKMKDTIYDHYIAIDWSIENMAIARMTKNPIKSF